MRPYAPEHVAGLKAVILRRRAAGENLEQIGASPGCPTRPTIRKWAREDPDFAQALATARRAHETRPRFPFDPGKARAFLLRIRQGEPVTVLIRDPVMPQRRELTSWKLQDPAFAAEYEASKAGADYDRRSLGRRHDDGRGDRRRSRMRYAEPIADRIILAVLRGATLPQLARDPTLPTKLGLKRWRRAHPDFDGALKVAMKGGHRARGKARVDRHCSPQLMDEIAQRLAMGASLHSLARQRDMPSSYALYKWVRDRPDFAADVARACDFRDDILLDRARDLARHIGPAARPVINALHKRLGQLRPYPGERGRRR